MALENKVYEALELLNLPEGSSSRGYIIGITGPMFSGKTTRLIQYLEKHLYGNKKCIAIKPALDDRYDAKKITTHLGASVDAFVINDSIELYGIILEYYEKPVEIKYNGSVFTLDGILKAVFIDEIQFFDSGIIDVVRNIAKKNIDVYWSGLNQDYRGMPFSFRDERDHIGTLMAISDKIESQTAVCVVCGNEATKTYKKSDSKKIIEIGGSEKYEPRCPSHWHLK